MKSRIPPRATGGQDMRELMFRAQKMQDDIKNVQDKLNEEEFTESVADGRVEVKMLGSRELTSLKISSELVASDSDREEIEDLILSAVNKIIKTIGDETESRIDNVTGGLNFPGMY